MNKDQLREHIFRYLTGDLTPDECERFEQQIESNTEVRMLVAQARELLHAEKSLAAKSYRAPNSFSHQVLAELNSSAAGFEGGYIKRLYMRLLAAIRRWMVMGGWKRWATSGALASICVGLFVMRSFTSTYFNAAHISMDAYDTGRSNALQNKDERLPSRPSVAITDSKEKKSGLGGRNELQGPAAPIQVQRQERNYPQPAVSKDRAVAAKSQEVMAFGELDSIGSPVISRPAQEVGAFDSSNGIAIYGEKRDRFVGYDETPRFQTTTNPVSTFSVDVDTASYTLARRNLQQGNLPAPESVRIEEFLNYFTYNYPTTSDKPFAFSYEMAPAPLQPGRHLLKLNIASKAEAVSRKPWNLVFLIDVSGSMSSSDKLELLKKSFPVLVKNLKDTDRVSIVTYAGNAGIALEPTSSKEKVLEAISTLGSGGSTNGAGGILAAYELAQKNFNQEGVNRVILATDGDFNVGTTSQEELVRLIEQKRQSGITLTTIGVGQGNLNDATLEQLANKGNGNYFYLDSFTEALNVFEQKLGSNIEVVAKDVKLQVEFNPSVVREYRLIGYDNRKLNREDFNNDAIDAGEIGAGHEVTALYEVTLVGSTVPTTVDPLRYGPTAAPTVAIVEDLPQSPELGFLKIRFKKPEGATSELLEFPLERAKIKHEVSEASNDFRFASAVAYFGTVLRGSQFKGDLTMKKIVELAQSGVGEDKDGSRREAVNLMRSAQSLRGE